MSLIEKAAERFERERAAKRNAKKGEVSQDPPPMTLEPASAADGQGSTPTSNAIPQDASRQRFTPTPPPDEPKWPQRATSGVPKQPTRVPNRAEPARVGGATARQNRTATAGTDTNANQSFRINFKSMEKLGFINRPFARGRLAEDLRGMKQRLMSRMNFFSLDAHRTGARPQNIVMVSSAWASEGKTFTAVNLALSLTLEDRVNVLLVDTDVIRPSIHKVFELPVTDGLTDYLRVGQSDLAPYLWRAENAPLSVLPAGNPVQVPRELFRSDEMSRFIYDISSRYSDRLVIVDTPPLLVTAEAPVLANHADQILIVVQASRTAQSAVEEAVDILAAEDNVSLVLNRCGDADRLTTPGYYGYGYYQQRAALPDAEDHS